MEEKLYDCYVLKVSEHYQKDKKVYRLKSWKVYPELTILESLAVSGVNGIVRLVGIKDNEQVNNLFDAHTIIGYESWAGIIDICVIQPNRKSSYAFDTNFKSYSIELKPAELKLKIDYFKRYKFEDYSIEIYRVWAPLTTIPKGWYKIPVGEKIIDGDMYFESGSYEHTYYWHECNVSYSPCKPNTVIDQQAMRRIENGEVNKVMSYQKHFVIRKQIIK